MTRMTRWTLGLLLAFVALLPPSPRLHAQGYSGGIINVAATGATGLGITYGSGTVFYGGGSQAITGSTLTATDAMTDCTAPGYASCNFVYWAGSGGSLSITTTTLTAFKPTNVVVAFCTTTGGNVSACVPASRQQGLPYVNYTDGSYFVSPSACLFTLTTTAADTNFPAFERAGAGQLAFTMQTNTTAGTVTFTCDITPPPSRTTAGTGLSITAVDLLYGIGTTTASAMAAPTINSTTGPAVGGAAAGTVSTTALGTLTVTPVSLQLTAVTNGLFYRLSAAAGTPLTYTGAGVQLVYEQAVTTAGTTKTKVQLYGLVVTYTRPSF